MPEKTTEELHAFDNSELDALMVSCGRRVYARLLERGGSKETAREGIKAALIHTYRAVQTSGCGDPLEALMYCCAEERQNFLIERAIESTVSEVLSDIGGESAETPARLSASGTAELSAPSAPEEPQTQEETPTAPPVHEEAREHAPVHETLPTQQREAVHAEPQTQEHMPEAGKAPVHAEPPAREAEETPPAREEAPAPQPETPPVPPGSDPVLQPEETPDSEAGEERLSFGSILLIAILVLCVFAAVWVVTGLMMSVGLIPKLDLGYSAFNTGVFPLF